MTPDLAVIDEVLDPREAAAVIEMSRRFPCYRPSSYRPGSRDVRVPQPFNPALGGRLDASRNFVRTGGRLGRTDEDRALLAARTNYFRATYAGDGVAASEVAERLLHHPRLKQAARELYGRPVVVPFVVYANVLIPGQELGIHTDVPAFRGVRRHAVAPWLLVVMRHSGRFEDRRIPIATIVLYLGESSGGEFVYYRDGGDGVAQVVLPRHNSCVVLDADSLFHGVDRVGGDEGALRGLRPDTELAYDDGWLLRDGRRPARYASGGVRFSVSWKAYCFASEAERRAAAAERSELPAEAVMETLADELRARGAFPAGERPSGLELAHLLIDEFVAFPPPAPAVERRV